MNHHPSRSKRLGGGFLRMYAKWGMLIRDSSVHLYILNVA